jgi:type II secretory pathway pseudopilin PulG
MKRQFVTFGTRRCTAFSLIELLVCIGVIVVLSALLLPALIAARGRGVETSCLSNVKQIVSAVQLYTADYSDQLPKAGIDAGYVWYQAIYPYVTSNEIVGCPSDTSAPSVVLWEPNSQPAPRRVSYAYNVHLGGMDGRAPGHPSTGLSDVIKPAATVLLTDTGSRALVGVEPSRWPLKPPMAERVWLADCTNGAVTSEGPTAPVAPMARHFKRTMVAFVDGHCKPLKIDTFYTLPDQVAPGETVVGLSPCLRADKGCP